MVGPAAHSAGDHDRRLSAASSDRRNSCRQGNRPAQWATISSPQRVKSQMFEISIQIDRPAQTVFRYIEDIESAPAWYSAVQSVTKLTAGPAGRGTRYAFSRELGGQVLENIVQVTEFEVDALLTLLSLNGPTPFNYRFRLVPKGNKTHHLEGSITGRGLPGAMVLLAPLASNFFERGMRANLLNLKRIVETARPAG
ncbi:MAG: hypothetical protein E5W83_14180 [Mesorhizobium sp.]|nr:MAG: hypothetical protein E5W83_14180 [Mesorhizobium sp.]